MNALLVRLLMNALFVRLLMNALLVRLWNLDINRGFGAR